jgi:hypothetical protein
LCWDGGRCLGGPAGWEPMRAVDVVSTPISAGRVVRSRGAEWAGQVCSMRVMTARPIWPAVAVAGRCR